MEGSTFTWNLENLLWNAFGKYDSIKRTMFSFFINGLKTTWKLEIFPSRTRKDIVIYLERIDNEASKEISVGFELSCVKADGNIMPALSKDKETFSTGRFIICKWKWSDLLKERLLYFPNGCFTIRCRLWAPSPITKPPVEYIAKSHIQTTRISYRKSIPILEALSSNYEIKCSPLLTDELEIILYRKDHSEYLSVKVHCKEAENKYLTCKVRVLDAEIILLHEAEEAYLFLPSFDRNSIEDGLENIQISDKEIWKLQDSIKLEELAKKMNSSNDVLSLEIEIVMGTMLVESHITNIKIIQPHNINPLNEYSKNAFDPLIHDLKTLYSEKKYAFYPLIQDLETLYSEKKYADVQLKSGKEMFSAHKVLLCTRSPVFSALFDNDMAEKNTGVVEIEDVDAPTLDKLLLFIYTGRLEDLAEDMAMKLLAAADKYQIISLKQQCASFLHEIISAQNACRFLQLADMHHEESLKKAAQEIICNNHRYILPSDEWTQFISLHGKLANEIFQKLSIKYSNL